ncbi:MAG TPA: hypothetical protein VIR33_05360, partial [Thermopolyspora sp.]
QPAVDETSARWPGLSGSATGRPGPDPRLGRPTVADVNAHSGYGRLAQDDGFILAPRHARDQGPGTDWITIQRKGTN